MSNYNNLFEEQKKNNTLVYEKESTTSFILCFSTNKSNFYTYLQTLHEIIPLKEIIPYPTASSMHLGVFNLRGKIIPIICPLLKEGQKPFNYSPEKLQQEHYSIIILKGPNNHPFAVLGKNITKKTVQENMDEERELRNIDSIPYHLFPMKTMHEILKCL